MFLGQTIGKEETTPQLLWAYNGMIQANVLMHNRSRSFPEHFNKKSRFNK